MANKFTQKAQNTLNSSLDIARELGHTYIGSEHLLLALISENDCIASRILSAKGAKAEKIRKSIIELAGAGTKSCVCSDDMTPRARKIIERSSAEAQKSSTRYIGTEHILLALLGERDCIAVRLLEAEGIPASELKTDISAYLTSSSTGRSYSSLPKESEEKHKSKASSVISQYGKDITEVARSHRLDPVIGRQEETDRVIRILSRRTKNNPCLVGEPGVGKTAVVEGLAQRIACGNVPDMLRDKKIISLDLPSMIAGAKYRGEFEERLKNVMREAAKDPDIILFIDELHTVVGAGAAEGAVDAANIIKPALARSELQLIGATTISEYRGHIEKDAALERRFCPVNVEEPSEDEAFEILLGLRHKYESHHRLKFTDEALRSAVTLSVRYLPDHFLPDKAIDLIDEAASKKRISIFTPSPELKMAEENLKELLRKKEEAICGQRFEEAADMRNRERELRLSISELRSSNHEENSATVSAEDIARVITERTGIPSGNLLEDESKRLLSLEEKLKRSVIGQDTAIKKVCAAVRRGRVGLGSKHAPIGSFLFVGQTGVGKTELARSLSQALFGSENALIRFDMSEYMEKHSVSKLIGSPPGYVGYGEGGQLTEKVRRHPYSVILFDEIEKAHSDIHHILLQVLEDGMLTDSTGRKIDFSNTILIMTSNAGSKSAASPRILGFGRSESERGDEETDRAIKDIFKPEFLNRIDEIITFSSLSISDIKLIAEKMLSDVAKRAHELGITLLFDDTLSDILAQNSYRSVYGARPLRRMIVKQVEDTLATEILEERIQLGDTITAFAQPAEGTSFSVGFRKKTALLSHA